MAADCRIGKGQESEEHSSRHNHTLTTPSSSSLSKTTRTKLTNFLLTLFVLIINLHSHQVCSLFLNCDSVQDCICAKEDDGGWRIECPNDVRERYPIELIVQKYNTSVAYLKVQCESYYDTTGERSPWSYFKGMDLSSSQVYAKISWLEINFCPPVQDGWRELLQKLNLTGSDITRFSFVTEARPSGGEPGITIPSNFFEAMPNIEILSLRQNGLTSIPDLSTLKNLQSVSLRDNQIVSVPQNTFSQNTQLNSIGLTYNKISEVDANTFPESLEHLALNNNQIARLNQSAFAHMKSLKRLYLNWNLLDEMDSDTFDGMPELEDLRLDNTKMTQFPNFNHLPKLVNLTISTAIWSRRLTTTSSVGQEPVTTTIAPDYLPENTLVLKNLPSLEVLTLRLNHFTSLPTLENLPKLRLIDLDRNDLTVIESGAFSGLPALKIIGLRQNKISKLGSIRATSLEELDVSFNALYEIRNDTFLYLGSLEKLYLAKNQIRDVAHKAFEPLYALKEFDMSHNQVTFSSSPYSGAGLTDELFGDLNNQSPLRSSLRLKKLNLSHNGIAKLGFSDWAQVFTQINEIDLSYNKIKRITANELNFISLNLTLNLENNEISVVDMQMSFLLDDNIDNASGSKEIRVSLSGNPLQCDCLAYGLKTFTSESYDLRIKNLSCNSPAELQGQKLIEVPDDSLLCDMEMEKGCPQPCLCKERTADKTVLIDCSDKNLTNEDIPPLNTFKRGYSRWSVELDLSDNEITDFNNTHYIKQFLNKTKHVDLSGNKLTSTVFLEKVQDYQTTTFSIANNPFQCNNCAFQNSWRAYPTKISDISNVTCLRASARDTSKYELVPVQEMKDAKEYCSETFSITLVIPLVIAVIFLSCLCVALFVTIKYGWAIKAYLYSKGLDWCLFWESEVEDDEDGNEKLYDAFISYSHKDEEWVVDELVNRLEEAEGFKLCLHFRDWTPGDWIPDQIVRSVDKSRRTIVILSKNFVDSVWSRLEFKAAHAQALKERSNRVILIMLGEDLKENDVQDDDLKMYMKMNTFMKWSDPLFWHRLKYALPHKKSEDRQHVINKMQQRERAIKLDKLRAKLEQNV